MVDRLRKTYLPFEVSFGEPQEKPKKVTKKELARLAKEVGEKYFYADCKKHGKGVKHLTSNESCTVCKCGYSKRYREGNRETCLQSTKKCYEKNKEAYLEQRKRHRRGNKEYYRNLYKKYRERHKEARSEYNKRYRKENTDYFKNYYENNKEVISERMRRYREENSAYYLARGVISRLDNEQQEFFSGITKEEAEALCGYSQVEFILHIESTFKDGMTWENRSEWHIDHILPVAWFKEQGITDLKVINALSNLRTEWASDNISKGRNFLEEDLTEEEFLEIIMNEVDDGKDF